MHITLNSPIKMFPNFDIVLMSMIMPMSVYKKIVNVAIWFCIGICVNGIVVSMYECVTVKLKDGKVRTADWRCLLPERTMVSIERGFIKIYPQYNDEQFVVQIGRFYWRYLPSTILGPSGFYWFYSFLQQYIGADISFYCSTVILMRD